MTHSVIIFNILWPYHVPRLTVYLFCLFLDEPENHEGWLITRNLKWISGLVNFWVSVNLTHPNTPAFWMNCVRCELYLSRNLSGINCCGITIPLYWHINYFNATKRCSLPLSLWAVPLRVVLGGTCATPSLHHQFYNCTSPPLTHFPVPHNAGAMVQQ